MYQLQLLSVCQALLSLAITFIGSFVSALVPVLGSRVTAELTVKSFIAALFPVSCAVQWKIAWCLYKGMTSLPYSARADAVFTYTADSD